MIYSHLVRPLLFRSSAGDPERVHEQTLAAISRLADAPTAHRAASAIWTRQRRPITVAGIPFPGRIGLAAGMDKNGLATRSWSALGFGHVEIGTVTARPQPGNEPPRLFRLQHSRAIVNRMGFNNDGASALADRLAAAGVRRGNGAAGLVVGVSIGKSKITPLAEAAADYLTCYRLLAPYADYLAVNVSSPNTPGLRTLQSGELLDELLATLVRAGSVPILVKISPDLDEAALEQVLEVCTRRGAAGLVATNTTVSRNGVDPRDRSVADQAGGLSGAPLAVRAREVVRFLTARTPLPVIGVGGVLSADDGRAMLDAGASLLQIYTGLVYSGPALVGALNRLQGEDRSG